MFLSSLLKSIQGKTQGKQQETQETQESPLDLEEKQRSVLNMTPQTFFSRLKKEC